jgi:hypothetical protein
MKERRCNFCTVFEDTVAWLFGWTGGSIIGCCVACSDYMEDNGDVINMITEAMRGAKRGFEAGTWFGHLDRKT